MQADRFDAKTVLDLLNSTHVGAANGATAESIVAELIGRKDVAYERQLRSVIVELRRWGVPVCATPRDGYFIAANSHELGQACKFLFERAMTSLEQVAAMKRVSLPDLAGQLGIDLEISHQKQESTDVSSQ